ncbi:unnamed protein product [Periconia digitata]|uniref:Uncharacterized protein n=1 Tax=Periconia digitata TaxID=1303443 RepID=A0A9W4U9Y1_9PLEO|nr:unnamed protein product [Periconia digitata]
MALEFLAPITTPAALRSVQADASPLITTILVLIGLSLEGGIIAWIHFATKDPNAKPKEKKKGGFFGFLKK